MTDRLSLYNGALRLLGQRKLATLTDANQARRALDQAWTGGAVDYCLEAGQWKFAARAVQLDASASVEPADWDGNYQFAFDKPSDHLRLMGVWSDGRMQTPLEDYREEGGFWLANLETIYIRYVSNDTAYGLDLSLWPQRFVKFVEAHLAYEVAMEITGKEEKRDDAFKLRERMKSDALSNDAMQEPTKTPPPGSWVLSRAGGRFSREQGR